MPDHGDDLVPSLLARQHVAGGAHVAYRHVAGVHRAEGLAGPTRRYAAIVLMLSTMASLPILAAISAGSATIDETAEAGGASPFIALPPSGPVVVVPLPPTPLPTDEPPAVGVGEPFLPAVRHKPPAWYAPIGKLNQPADPVRSRDRSTTRRPNQRDGPPVSEPPRPASPPKHGPRELVGCSGKTWPCWESSQRAPKASFSTPTTLWVARPPVYIRRTQPSFRQR